MATDSTLLIGTVWDFRDIRDLFEKKVKKHFKIGSKVNINWTVSDPNYCYISLEFRGKNVMFHLHLNETFFGLKCNALVVQNSYNNPEIISFLEGIATITGGLFEIKEGNGFKSYPENYSRNEGFLDRRKFLGIPTK